ncbi:ferroxidase fet3 [Tulasnella sp. 427]|nr:ferroxidase fet3 [Tulasnella sp. 427]
MWKSAVSLPLLALASGVAADVREYWWNIDYTQANPDGLFERRVIGVNGTWPPPPIEVFKGDTLRLHVNNQLEAPTAIHHHGMFLHNSSYFDGAVGVTQCPIPQGASFSYEVPIGDQVGTYWAHGHFSGQYVDGLRTPFIIHNQAEPHKYDTEYTIILADWYHDEHSVLSNQFMSIANPGGAEPVPEAAIMYFSQNGQYLQGFNENATLPFEPGKTYRLRVINMSALAMFWFWIDGHDMQVIEVDGTDVEAAPVELQSVSVAQRYSFLVTARNDTSSNWLIHANMDPDMFDGVPDTLQLNITSVISYPGATTTTEQRTEVDEYANSVDDVNFAPLTPETVKVPDVSIPLNVFFDTYDNGVNRASFENITYNGPLVPTILSAMTLGSNAANPKAYGPSASVLSYGETVELLVVNWDAGNHPFHLHGHKFALVWKSYDVTSDDPSINPPLTENLPNPMWRDTIHIPSGGAVRIRFVANNPGAWFFHCHIDWHLTAGLAWAFIEAPDYMQKWLTIPDEVTQQCQQAGIKTSGNAAGHDDPEDWTNLPLGPYPQKLGWTPRGIGAMFACVFTATLGMATVVWYGLTGMGDV